MWTAAIFGVNLSCILSLSIQKKALILLSKKDILINFNVAWNWKMNAIHVKRKAVNKTYETLQPKPM